VEKDNLNALGATRRSLLVGSQAAFIADLFDRAA
jgi:hypothetical protein